MSNNNRHIRVNNDVHKELQVMKYKQGFATINEVIKSLLDKSIDKKIRG
ncbi:putative CopG family antitoxin [Methanococcus voltae]|uniref:Putative CopG family antitoxin n=1 Tax=Methanococcus voltae TaxID=2188 RepID=A0A8J7URX6_METVO|nr:hypothetical protein [Methanococcus voltae]MBP2202228.1 putative CopG family antitoxin [Methanococcus voltae]